MATATQRRRKHISRRAHALRYDHRKRGHRDEPVRQHVVVKTHVQWSRKKKVKPVLEFDGSEEYITDERTLTLQEEYIDSLSDFKPEGFFIDGKAFRYKEDGTTEECDPSVLGFMGMPKRSKCHQCGRSQKVKRDGTLGRHYIYNTERVMIGNCAGSGQLCSELSGGAQ